MPELRHILPAAVLLAGLQIITFAQAAEVPDGLDATRSLAQAGASQLALQHIDTLQPQFAGGPSLKGISFGAPPEGTSTGARWAEWETLRLQLLTRLNRNDEVLQRAGVLPASLPDEARSGLQIMAARAALAMARTAVARDLAGRALWTPGLNPGVARELRLLVIRSYVRDARTDDAYRSMLRFEQDYRPLDAVTAGVFVDALLDLKMTREALAWLSLLEERGPAKLRLRLHAGVLTPQDAVTQAHAALARSEDPAWWRILFEAAERQNNGALRLAALEQLLEAASAEVPDATAGAGALWEAYTSHARAAANSHHLLAGDEANWLEFAIRRRTTEPAESRAYLAFLARSARNTGLQQNAQIRLVADFAESRLPRAGLRLFGAWPADAGVIAATTRYTLGMMAEAAGDHPRALDYWQGLPAPDNIPAAVWKLRLSALAIRAGRAEVAIEIAASLAEERSAIPAVQLPEWITLAQQFSDHGLHESARALFARVLPFADAVQTRLLLSGIAQSHVVRGQPLQAAEFYLRAALRATQGDFLRGAPAADAAATEARLKAGFSLARAGLGEDAKAQFEWVLKNASDPAHIAVARRELGF